MEQSKLSENIRQNKCDVFDPLCGIGITTLIIGSMFIGNKPDVMHYVISGGAAALFGSATICKAQEYFQQRRALKNDKT